MRIQQVAIGTIAVGERTRKKMGDMDSLKASMTRLGLLHPIVVDGNINLIAGARRLQAAREMGWDTIAANVANNLDEAILALEAERDENGCRESFTPSEIADLAKRLRAIEEPKAAERQKAAGGGHGNQYSTKKLESGGVSESDTPPKPRKPQRVDAKIAASRGIGKGKLRQIEEVAAAAESEPEKFGDLPEKMDTVSVNAAHKELKARKAAVVDAWDIPIQPHAEEAFKAVPDFNELIQLIRKSQQTFNRVANLHGGKFLTLPFVSSFRRGKKGEDGEHADRFVMPELEAALQKVKNAIPAHTVCPWNYVEAPHPEDCKTCHGLNWTTPLSKNAEVAKDKVQEAFKNV
jgi:ParB-like chromosome segregation protein Spo0J